MDARWYKNAVIYCLDVDSFKDGNDDGIGDFRGLGSQLDYLAGLGITCIWLLPFYPSPDRDNGYDVTDYYSVDPRLGDMGDFVDFVRAARERSIRVIVDLVINHTSDQHPWFQNAREGRYAKYHDYYVWSDSPPAASEDQVIFPGHQKSLWTYDEKACRHYLHNFFKHQPDLNMENPAVREEIRKIISFWLELGISGFRLDAVPFAIGMEGTEGMQRQKIDYEYLNELREHASWQRGDTILLAEANVRETDLPKYFGDGDRMHLLFNFQLNQRLFLAFARQSARPLRRCLPDLPKLPRTCQWANFLRNHDELNLGKLSEEERLECFRNFAPDEGMRLYGRGIRRRLAPILENDHERILHAFSLMFSLPGTPVLWYGEEIGMGEDLSLPERAAVRTPMQWSGETNGGFSRAPAHKLRRPTVEDGSYGYRKKNVELAECDPDSLLNGVERIIRARRNCPEIGSGEWRLLDVSSEEDVFAHLCSWRERATAFLHNMTDEEKEVLLKLEHCSSAVDLLRKNERTPVNGGELKLRLPPYGFRWLRLHSK